MNKEQIDNLSIEDANASGYNILVELYLPNKKERITDSGIIIPDEYTAKVEGQVHTVVTDEGMVKFVKVLSIGDKVKIPIDKGDICLIPMCTPETLEVPFLSTEDIKVGMIAEGMVNAYWKVKK